MFSAHHKGTRTRMGIQFWTMKDDHDNGLFSVVSWRWTMKIEFVSGVCHRRMTFEKKILDVFLKVEKRKFN